MPGAESVARHRRSRLLSALLVLAMMGLVAYCGWIVAEWDGIAWSVLAGVMMLMLIRRLPPSLILRAVGARPVLRREAPALFDIRDALCRRAGLAEAPLLYWVGERFPVAFTIGSGGATAIALSRG